MPTDDELPRRFGGYTLEELLGVGGMGRVYRAVFHGPAGFTKPVALKVLKARNQDHLQAFFGREARIGGWLHHPNVVEIYDFGSQDGTPFLAMEFIDGWPLDQFLALHPAPPPSVILDLAIQIARGLQHAHDLKVDEVPLHLIHRDLKPANVLVSRDGGVKVVDFGLARPMRSAAESGLTSVGMLVGTPAYMSPEQPDSREDLDLRSDIFAFGVVLYELVTGQHPWPRANLLEKLDALGQVDQLTAAPGFWDAPRRSLPGVEFILKSCLRQEPAERFHDSRALIAALRNLQRGSSPIPDLRAWVQAGPKGRSALPSAPGPPPKETARAGLPPTAPSAPEDAEIAPPAPGPEVAPGGPPTRPVTRHNLPADRDAFIGRQEDLTGLLENLDRGQRLITLVGPGGTGKTRLSLRLGAKAKRHFPGGVFFCDLTEARSRAHIVSAVASSMNVPLDDAQPVDQLGLAIAGHGSVLLILDNFEQVVEFADATIGRWLHLSPEAHFAVTSRTRLGLDGEAVYGLAPLPPEDAIELFFTRARAVRPMLDRTPENTPTVREIVAKLDGLPLAIELAAARSRILTLEKLLGRLSDRFRLLQIHRGDLDRRHATLRGAIEWSWQLLSPWEQLALAQSSVFRGGFTRESADAVLDLDAFDEAPWTVDVVNALEEQSLLRRTEPKPGHLRYQLLESTQAFAEEKLTKLGFRDEMQIRHLEYFAEMGTKTALNALFVDGGVEHFRALTLDLENLRQGEAAGRALGRPDARAHCALAVAHTLEIDGAIPDAIEILGQISKEISPGKTANRVLLKQSELKLHAEGLAENQQAIERVLETSRNQGDRINEANSLKLLGAIHRRSKIAHDARLAHKHYSDALEIFCELGDWHGKATTLVELGLIDQAAGQSALAQRQLEQALEISRSLRDRRTEATCLITLGDLLRNTASEQALELLNLGLRIAREWGNRRQESVALLHLGNLYLTTNRIDVSRSYYEAGFEISRGLGSPASERCFLSNLGIVSMESGQLPLAQTYFKATAAICREVGLRLGEGIALVGLGVTNLGLECAESAIDFLTEAVTIFRELGDSPELANALSGLGSALLLKGDPNQAENRFRESIQLSRNALESNPLSGCNPFRHFCGLALALAHQGDFETAIALIDEATPALQTDLAADYVELLSKQAMIQWLAGEAQSADTSLELAQSLAKDLNIHPASPLGRAIERARQFCSPGR